MERNVPDRPKRPTVHTFEPALVLKDIAPGEYSVHLEASSSLEEAGSVSREIPISVR